MTLILAAQTAFWKFSVLFFSHYNSSSQNPESQAGSPPRLGKPVGLLVRVLLPSVCHLQRVIRPCSLSQCLYYPELSAPGVLPVTGRWQLMGIVWPTPPPITATLLSCAVPHFPTKHFALKTQLWLLPHKPLCLR